MIELAEAVAREAGALLREHFAAGRLETSTKTSPTDLVSEADLAAERLIRERLLEARPYDGILAEEGEEGIGSSGLRWVVDPLDGTINFLFGIPQWCVSIGVEDADGTVAGVIFDPMRNELWSVQRDGPPLLNGEVVAASTRSDMATAMVATGFGYDAEVRAVQGQVIARLLPRVRDIRRFGSAALDLAWTAAGRYDAYFERETQPWDVAAGRLLCERAGLGVRELEAAPPTAWGLVVAPEAFVDELTAAVVDAHR